MKNVDSFHPAVKLTSQNSAEFSAFYNGLKLYMNPRPLLNFSRVSVLAVVFYKCAKVIKSFGSTSYINPSIAKVHKIHIGHTL